MGCAIKSRKSSDTKDFKGDREGSKGRLCQVVQGRGERGITWLVSEIYSPSPKIGRGGRAEREKSAGSSRKK